MTKICPNCKKIFVPAMRWQIYCTPKCQSNAWYKRNKEKVKARLKQNERRKNVELKVCRNCGKQFMSKKYDQIYCSPSCAQAFWKKNNPKKIKETEERYRKSHPEQIKKRHRKYILKKKYGITIEEYNKMLEKQAGVCAICHEEKDETLAVDHDHKTGKIRGLLCFHCNHVVGFAKDNIEILNNVIEYLTE